MRAAPCRHRGRGFTLLEVLIALTICATALAMLFGVIAGSKDLTFRAQQALNRSGELRNLANLSLLVDASGELLVPADATTESDYRVNLDGEELEVPERKTAATTETLRPFQIENADGDVILSGTYWVTLEEAE